MSNPEQDPSQNLNLHLHICPKCDSKLVQPTRLEEAYRRFGQPVWSLERRCPECEWSDLGLIEDSEKYEFEEKHIEGSLILAEELQKLEISNMREELGVFVLALEENAILPEDF